MHLFKICYVIPAGNSYTLNMGNFMAAFLGSISSKRSSNCGPFYQLLYILLDKIVERTVKPKIPIKVGRRGQN